MNRKSILITAPSLDTKHNVSGISSVTNFIISNNTTRNYKHFELGRKDNEKRNLAWVFKIIRTMFKWVSAIRDKEIALVHFNFPLSKPSVLRDAPLLILTKLFRKKMIIHLHGGDYLTSKKAPRWMRFILKRVFSGNNPVIVLSPLEKKVITEEYSIKNVTVLPNCVDLKDAKAFNRSFDDNGIFNILSIGRISIPKGIERIYQSLVLLKQRNVKLNFYLAGTGPEEAAYKEKFSALLGDAFHFEGIVSGKTKTALFERCNVYLLPSYFEGLPMSLLESMSFGLVPIVTGVGSIKYVVTTGETGVIVDNDPAAETDAAIKSFETDTALLKKLSVNASRFIFENYNPENYIARLNTLYDGLTG